MHSAMPRHAGPDCVSVRYTVHTLSSSGNLESADCQRRAGCSEEQLYKLVDAHFPRAGVPS